MWVNSSLLGKGDNSCKYLHQDAVSLYKYFNSRIENVTKKLPYHT